MRSFLVEQINDIMRRQGYDISKDGFSLANYAMDGLRRTHSLAKKERMAEQIEFIKDNAWCVQDHMINGKDLIVKNIVPKLIPVAASSKWAMLFRWWNHVWWSVPYERAYGRQMRYVVWDDYHQAVIGLIGLQSPILSWEPRDRHLGIPVAERDYWVNQSMSAQRLGAVPPYNVVLGSKLIAMLMVSDTLRKDFHKKYAKKSTVLQKRTLPANLLFVTTTGAFGKSSIYTRLKLGDEWLAKFIGYSNGSGSFHIPNEVYEKLLVVLSKKGTDIKRGYGTGPSRKMRLIRQGMAALGYKSGHLHGIKRAIYLFPFAKNVHSLITGEHQRPRWYHRRETDLTDFWKSRWILPRIDTRRRQLFSFKKKRFINEQQGEIDSL